jgi:hypothetical protein
MERVGIHKQFSVRINGGRLRESAQIFYVPDVFVFPTEYSIPLRNKLDVLEVYSQPVTLVVSTDQRTSSLSQNRTVAKGSGQDWCARRCG